MAFRTFIKSSGKNLTPDRSLKWKFFKDKNDTQYNSICCPNGCGPMSSMKNGWLICQEEDCLWQSDTWYWENIFYTKCYDEDEFKGVEVLIGKCKDHEGGANAITDFSQFITGASYEVNANSNKRKQRVRKSMRVEISTAEENFGRIRSYCTGSSTKDSCNFSVWLDEIEENRKVFFAGQLSNWDDDIEQDESLRPEEKEYYHKMVNEMKFIRGCYLGCLSIIRPLMNSKPKEKENMMEVIKEITKYAVDFTDEVNIF